MAKLKVKGYEIEHKITKSAYDRKAVLFANNIIDELKKLGVDRDQVEIKLDTIGNKNLPATIEWWSDGHHLQFTYGGAKRFIDNLYMIMKVMELEIKAVLSGEKEMNDFVFGFTEEDNVKKDRSEAREILGLDEKENDIDVINKAYKDLAKKHHPDMGGNLDEFKKVNKAHKLLKKEMGL